MPRWATEVVATAVSVSWQRPDPMISYLPHLNATLNGLAILVLLAGYAAIRRGHESWHKRCMLAAFGLSTAFLTSYLVYHIGHAGSTPFPEYPPRPVRYAYYTMLISHIALAALVPPLAMVTIWLGLSDRRSHHRRLARWTLPIWLYVSITGVLVYVALYHAYPPR